MGKTPRYRRKRKKSSPLVPALAGIVAVLSAVLLLLILFLPEKKSPETLSATRPTVPTQTAQPTEETTVQTETTVPETTAETEAQILPYFVEMARNPDFVGWIKITGTKLDCPLMYTPGDGEKYLRRNMEGEYSVGGVPFIDEHCSLDPRSDNLIIYGHNMKNGTMFRTLMEYDQRDYWEEHPVIYLSSLYEEKEYEILAAFYDKVYMKTDTCFKFYQFIDAEDEEDFNEAIAYFKKHALYDTGVTAAYGDKLITLVTCSYHVDNGRFVVVAREKQ